VTVFLAGGQGLYELYQAGRGLEESLWQINWTWITAFTVTSLGVAITSGFIWQTFIARRAAGARLSAALKMAVRSLDLGEEANARVTVYIAQLDRRGGHILYQECPYEYAHFPLRPYGLGHAGLLESTGIVGHVFRAVGNPPSEGLHAFVPNGTPEEFIKGLVQPPWNFPSDLAQRIDRERPSYMAFRFSRPAERGKPALDGVIFFDAKGKTAVFNDEVLARVRREQVELIVDYVEAFFP
jgi:hypothetical protein